jgi:hypothetical protein
VAALIGWNFMATGYLSGADRGSTATRVFEWRDIVTNAADMGWSLPAAFMAARLRLICGGEGGPAVLIGLVIWSLGLGLFTSAWIRGRQPWSRAIALVGASYWVGMVALRTVGDFVSLFNARTFVPVAVFFALCAFDHVAEWPSARLRAALLFLVAVECLVAVRGRSRGFAGDIRPAVALIQPRLGPEDSIQINEEAFTIAAYFVQPVELTGIEYWPQVAHKRFLVIAGVPQDRMGATVAMNPDWAAFARRLIGNHDYRALMDEPNLIVLERLAPPQ